MASIDLNADIGAASGSSSMSDDEAILGVITSANVACGYHAGDPSTMRRACRAAAERGVAIGAHVASPDLAGSGRRHVEMDPAKLRDAVLYQIGALDGFAQVAGTGVGYVKPHGALYHACIADPRTAEAVAAAAFDYDPAMAVLGPPDSHLLEMVDANGMEAVAEAFADRAYQPDRRPVASGLPGAVLDDPHEVAERAVRLALDRLVEAVDGTAVPISARSIGVHGDTPEALALARAVRDALVGHGVQLHPFVVP